MMIYVRPGYDVKLHPDVQAFNVPFLELYIRNCFVVVSRYSVLSLLLKRIVKIFSQLLKKDS